MSRWVTIAPINGEWTGPNFEATEPIEIGWGVSLIPLPEWLKQEKITRYMSLIERNVSVGQAKFALVTEYAADGLGDPDPDSTGGPVSKQQMAAERLKRANLGLWLARPSLAGFRMVISAHEDRNEWILGEHHSESPIRPFEEDAGNQPSLEDFSLAKRLGDAASSIRVDNAAWVAMMLSWRALTEVWWENRYLLFWVALESLFGSLNPTETTYRLSQRLAFFLSKERSQARELYDRAKAGYDARSRVVHGFRHLSLGKDKADRLLADTECFVRSAFHKILTDPAHIATFANEQKREKFLDGLVFG